MAANALDTPLTAPGSSVTFSGGNSSPRAYFADLGSVSRRALITPPPPGLAISAGHLGSFSPAQQPSPSPSGNGGGGGGGGLGGNLGALLRNELGGGGSGGGSLTSQPRPGSASGVPHGGMLGVHFSAAVFNDGEDRGWGRGEVLSSPCTVKNLGEARKQDKTCSRMQEYGGIP